MPAAGRDGGGAGLVLEQPAAEAATRPVAAARPAGWRPGRAVVARAPGTSSDRHAVVGQPLLGDGTAVAVAGQLGPEGAGVEDGARRPGVPVSSAWPMPSPVSGSHAPAASPTNRARPWARTARSMRAGMGQALWGAAATAAGPRASAMWGRASSSGHSAFMSRTRRSPSRSTPKPTLARPPGSGKDHA